MDTSKPEEKCESTKKKMTTSAPMKMAEAGSGLYSAATATDDDDDDDDYDIDIWRFHNYMIRKARCNK
jgi:hypothetical protein